MRSLHRTAVLCVALTGGGCGGAQNGPPPAVPSAVVEGELAVLRARAETQEERIRELEGLLALARAEVRDLRDAAAEDQAPPPRTVRIGEPAQPEPEPSLAWEDPPEEVAEGPRPVLRLYGEPTRLGPPPPLVVPAPPPGIPDRLPVVPLPGEESIPPPELTAPARATAVAPDAAEIAYREALALVRDRAFERAERALSRLIEDHARHERVADALYWRGVVRYAARAYERALADFERVVRASRDGERASEAMLKMAMCHARMGDAARARDLFRRVRTEYPNTVAARLASQEDAS